ncbi:hypothetical protein DUNSADRAFT_6235, partial [Dunaliella salina]
RPLTKHALDPLHIARLPLHKAHPPCTQHTLAPTRKACLLSGTAHPPSHKAHPSSPAHSTSSLAQSTPTLHAAHPCSRAQPCHSMALTPSLALRHAHSTLLLQTLPHMCTCGRGHPCSCTHGPYHAHSTPLLLCAAVAQYSLAPTFAHMDIARFCNSPCPTCAPAPEYNLAPTHIACLPLCKAHPPLHIAHPCSHGSHGTHALAPTLSSMHTHGLIHICSHAHSTPSLVQSTPTFARSTPMLPWAAMAQFALAPTLALRHAHSTLLLQTLPHMCFCGRGHPCSHTHGAPVLVQSTTTLTHSTPMLPCAAMAQHALAPTLAPTPCPTCTPQPIEHLCSHTRSTLMLKTLPHMRTCVRRLRQLLVPAVFGDARARGQAYERLGSLRQRAESVGGDFSEAHIGGTGELAAFALGGCVHVVNVVLRER